MNIPVTLLSILATSFLLTFFLRSYALKNNIIDNPNARSSHSIPTPRGGGVAIVLCFIAFCGMGVTLNIVPGVIGYGIIVAGLIVATVGFIDDHNHIPAGWRLLAHFSSAFVLLWASSGLPAITIFGFTFSFGAAGYLIGGLYLVWLLNLYNFMDGIDGLAGIEAATVCFFAALLSFSIGTPVFVWLLPLVLGTACLGFLLLNFPPAKIFMGDAGSGFIGLILGGLSLFAAQQQSQLLWVWLILLGVFIVDATITLIRRLSSGYKPYEAHRTHAYQYASRHHGSHRVVTISVLAINAFWLFPVASMVALNWIDGALGTAVAYFPLAVVAIKYNAGKAE
ncbi:glycosyl transferase [Photobacterium proteolyticum]|uniref:Glycosyl transferase n=1 Tax=Photobacterium proteolyticum TaxID=1903952 RepID=A0A1Q9GN52_9GAMM|nr:glycosyltransferase family 4 protein [Photobacterium proteolyticum]OLQ76092.1 glycosyl transferase [Photobacterium proteolyticum]